MKTNLLIILGLMLLAGAAWALNQMTLVAQYDGEASGNYFGTGLTMGDFDNDGHEEFVIGAYGWNTNTGKNYYYDWNGDWPTAPTWTVQGDTLYASYDYSDANLGDLNGDGIPDLGIPQFSLGPLFAGKLDIYFGSATFDTIPDWSMSAGLPVIYYAAGLDSCGDINGDGGADFILRVDYDSDDYALLEIYYGGDVLDSVEDITMMANTNAKPLGDVNADGYADILVFGGGQPVRLFFGGDPMDTIPDLSFYDYAFGAAAGVGDINGDGVNDLCISMRLMDSTGVYSYIYFGGPEIDNVPDLILQNMFGQPWSIGNALCSGDLNGDGYSDIVGGTGQAPYGDVIYIWLGGADFNPSPDAIIGSWSISNNFGHTVATGDVDGDGCDELLVGATEALGFGRGRCYLYDGPPEWIDYGAAVSPEDLQRQPQGFLLAQNFPNPFNSTTSIHFEMARRGVINLTIYDLRGNQIKNLISGQQMTPGGYNVSWTGVNENQQPVSSGIYLLELKLDQYCQVRKIVLIR